MFFLGIIHLALLTSDTIAESDKPDDKLLIEALCEYDVEARSIDWRSSDLSETHFDAAIIFSCWDYYTDCGSFLNAIERLEQKGVKVYNPSPVVKWNSCKTYLRQLEKLGIKTIETLYLNSQELPDLKNMLLEKGWDECVIKPQISADGYRTHRFNLSGIDPMMKLSKDLNERWMIQPFAEEIITEGEWSFVFLEHEFIHCVIKKPLEGHFRVQGGLKIAVDPPVRLLKKIQKIHRIVHRIFDVSIFQTRIDIICRGDEIRVMEIEMIEPSWYLHYFPGSERKVARKIKERFDRDVGNRQG